MTFSWSNFKQLFSKSCQKDTMFRALPVLPPSFLTRYFFCFKCYCLVDIHKPARRCVILVCCTKKRDSYITMWLFMLHNPTFALYFEYINNFFQNIVPHQTYIYCRNCHLNVCKAGTVQLQGFYFGLI